MIGGALPSNGDSSSESKYPAHLTTAAPPSRGGQFACLMINTVASFLKNKGMKNNFAMVHTREDVFSKVLKLPGI